MKCKVVLFGEGQAQNFSCFGELVLNGKRFNLSYVFGGDSCLLTYDGKILRHEKKGEIPVCIEFTENRNTLCKIGSGGFYGEIPVLTNSLDVRLGTDNIFVNVVYRLDGDVKQMKISAESL